MATAVNQDTFFTNLFQTGMTDPNSKAYLPTMIMDTTNPSLNPYTKDLLDLGRQNVKGMFLNIKLTNLKIEGIPNISISSNQGGEFKLAGLDITFGAQFCKLSPSPENIGNKLTFSSDFELSFPGNSLLGSFSTDINQGFLDGTMTISGNQLESIVTTIKTIEVGIPSSATVTPTVTFDQPSDFWSSFLEGYLKKDSTVQMMLGKINEQIQTESEMEQLSQELTTILQNVIKKQLNN